MKLKLIFIVGLILLLSGCLDSIHYISRIEDRIHSYFQLTIPKALLEMGNNFAGNGTTSDPTCGDNFTTLPDELSGFSEFPGIIFEPKAIDSTFECGIGFSLSGRVADINALPPIDQLALIPTFNQNTMTIHFPVQNGFTDNDIGLTFMINSKYSLTISKAVAGSIIKAKFNTDGNTYPIDILQLADASLIQFPFGLWLTSTDQASLYIEFEHVVR